MRALQKFSDEYLEQCKKLKPDQILGFIEQFQRVHSGVNNAQTKLISLKVNADLLEAFKQKAKLSGVKYQTQIKLLMTEWLKK